MRKRRAARAADARSVNEFKTDPIKLALVDECKRSNYARHGVGDAQVEVCEPTTNLNRAAKRSSEVASNSSEHVTVEITIYDESALIKNTLVARNWDE